MSADASTMLDTPTKRSIEDGKEGPPAKRGRGRPPKDPNAPCPLPKDSKAPKRSRGRPAKDPEAPLSLSKDPHAPSRGHGRPPKDPNAPRTPPRALKDPNVPSRGNGRPLKGAGTSSGDPSMQSKDVHVPSPPQQVAKDLTTQVPTRGRPKENTNKHSGAPKRRGRPPKDPSEKASRDGYKGKYSSKAKGTGLLEDIIGSYALRCDEVGDNWPDAAEDMNLSISALPHTSNALVASFDLGILEGTMLLAADEAALERVRIQMDKGDDPPKDKISSTPIIRNRTVFFMWRGRNTGNDNEVHSGISGTQKGVLKYFTDDRFIKFKGTGAFPALGHDCVFFGTKMAGQSSGEPQPWSAFQVGI